MHIKCPSVGFVFAAAAAVLIALPLSALAQAPERFPDFGFLPLPDEYGGKLFKLSQKYPAPQPGVSALPDFFRFDFERHWKEYLLAVRAYCFENNIGHADIEDDFRLEEAMKDTTKPVPWYHMPWQHFGALGREGVHGLTKEAPVAAYALAKEQKTAGQTYAVAFYNLAAASAIGKVWAHFIPDPLVTSVPGGGFPEGSVIFKLLFVTNPVEEIPFLADSKECVEWQASVTEKFTLNPAEPRHVRKLHLIQMDIMVKDARAPLKWVFGTFQYNSRIKDPVKWNRLVPVGVMWSNDPNDRDADPNTSPEHNARKVDMRDLLATPQNKGLKGTIINPDRDLPVTHLGWNGRLNGPVDNPMSSCLSCHQTAQYPSASVLAPVFISPENEIPLQGSDAWMVWFRDLPCGQPFDQGTASTDGSLQLSMSILNFYTWFKTQQGGVVPSEYLQKKTGAQSGTEATATPGVASPPKSSGPIENQPILRGQ